MYELLGYLSAGAIIKYVTLSSNKDEYRKYLEMVGEVSSLNLHPLKSARVISLKTATCTDQGIKSKDVNDRSYLIVKPNGAFLTSRVIPKIAMIECSIIEGGLCLTFPGMKDLHITNDVNLRGKIIESRVWDECAEGRDCGEEAADWIQNCLQTPELRIVHGDASLKKRSIVDRRDKWTAHASAKDKIIFQDRYPYLISSEASLEDLNTKLKTPVQMNRFRPNIVVKGCPKFDEDDWGDIYIGKIHFRNLKPCQRCLLTTVNPEDGTKDSKYLEPLSTLNTYRLTCPDYPRNPIFGSLLVLEGKPGDITVGDKVYVRRKE